MKVSFCVLAVSLMVWLTGDLNQEIVPAGFAWWFRRYAPSDKELGKLESEAREAKTQLVVESVPPGSGDAR